MVNSLPKQQTRTSPPPRPTGGMRQRVPVDGMRQHLDSDIERVAVERNRRTCGTPRPRVIPGAHNKARRDVAKEGPIPPRPRSRPGQPVPRRPRAAAASPRAQAKVEAPPRFAEPSPFEGEEGCWSSQNDAGAAAEDAGGSVCREACDAAGGSVCCSWCGAAGGSVCCSWWLSVLCV